MIGIEDKWYTDSILESFLTISYPPTQHDFWFGVGCFCIQHLPSSVNVEVVMEVWTKDILYWFIEGQTHIGMPRGAKMNLALNEPKQVTLYTTSITTFEHTPQVKKILILYAKHQWKIIGTNFQQNIQLSWKITLMSDLVILISGRRLNFEESLSSHISLSFKGKHNIDSPEHFG